MASVPTRTRANVRHTKSSHTLSPVHFYPACVERSLHEAGHSLGLTAATHALDSQLAFVCPAPLGCSKGRTRFECRTELTLEGADPRSGQ